MMKVLHALPGKNESDKPFWTQVGVAFPAKSGNGFSIRLNYLPVAAEDGAVSLIVREDDSERRPRHQPDTAAPLDDEVPF